MERASRFVPVIALRTHYKNCFGFSVSPDPANAGFGRLQGYLCDVNPQAAAELRDFLEDQTTAFNVREFIPEDPISIPHLFSCKEDIEISGFLAATIAWGQRPVILRNANRLLRQMDFAPADFIRHHTPAERKKFSDFVHRTFNGTDALYFLKSLQQLYIRHGGLEGSFMKSWEATGNFGATIHHWRNLFFSFDAPERTFKHFADPLANSSAKRICMFLRWMIRTDNSGVDFGIWKKMSPAVLHAPLDLHSGRIARELGLLNRNQNDWKAVLELTENLKLLDPADPVKYDYALFGLGVSLK
jgi:uncharacterized protein (TIGR02757 family)